MTEQIPQSDESSPSLYEDALRGRLTRRAALKHAAAMGLSAPAIAGLLAACGGDDDDDGGETSGTSVPAQEPTSTTAEDEPTATLAESEPTATVASTDEGTPTAEAAEPTSTTESAAESGGGGRLNILSWQAATILNSHFAQGSKDHEAVRIYAEPLADYDQDGNLVPFLASEIPSLESGDVAADGMSVTWHLREGVLWHDGTPFTARDVVFTWQYATHPDSSTTTAGSFEPVEDIEVIDDFTVKVIFNAPTPAWYNTFTSSSGIIVPEHLLRDVIGAAARDAPFNLAPIGTGPYAVVDFRPGDTTIYEANKNYWEAGKPYFDEIELKGGGDAVSAARAVLEAGEFDFAPHIQIEPDLLELFLATGIGSVEPLKASAVERVALNFSDPNVEVGGERSHISVPHPALSEPAFRQALALLCDRDSISTELFGLGGEPTANIIAGPPRFVSPNTSYEFNVEKAAETLDAAGWEIQDGVRTKNGYQARFVFASTTDGVRQKIQEIIKQSCEEVGIKVEIKAVESSVFFSSDPGNPDTWTHFYCDLQLWASGGAIYPLQYMEAYRSSNPETDIPQKANQWRGRNASRWINEEFNGLFEQAQVELDPDTQDELFIAMNDLVVNEIVHVPLVWRAVPYGYLNTLAGQKPSGWSSMYWNIKDWYREG